MKKTLLLVAFMICAFVMSVNGQSKLVLLSESFNENQMPQGWSVTGMGTTNWALSASALAGGQANELAVNYSPQFNGVSRLVTPVMDLTGIQSVIFQFKHSLDYYGGTIKLGIATSSDMGATWNTIWSQNFTADAVEKVISQTVNNADMNHSAVMFSVFIEGDSYNFDYWYFDDFKVFVWEQNDASVDAITTNSYVGAGETEIGFTMTNMGAIPVTSFNAEYQFGGYEAVAQTFENVSVGPFASKNFTFAVKKNLIPGLHNVAVRILDINGGIADDDMSNNEINKNISAALGAAQRIPMIEHFSSSTCGPCVSVNSTMAGVTAANPGKYTYTKYPMNWPGNGDPYYTAEGGVRRNYYGVNAVPAMYLDGASKTPVTASDLLTEYAVPAFVDVQGTYSINGTNVTVNADILSYVDIEAARVYISVNEKTTTQNIGGNGENSFHHIMMKMLPDANGTTLALVSGEIASLNLSADLAASNVEEMSDLEVSVWVQNYGTKEVLNSHFMEMSETALSAPRNLSLTKNEENGTIDLAWEAPENATPTGYTISYNGENATTNATAYTISATNNTYYIIKVAANYGDQSSLPLVKGMLFGNDVNVAENEASNLSVYPNPANDMIIVAGENMNMVNIYNTLGVLVASYNVENNFVQINTTNMAEGIYFFTATQENGATSTRKVVVKH